LLSKVSLDCSATRIIPAIKKYNRIATGIRYDHLAILLNERGAGTPDDGVGMWVPM
jgi:hypothetical protein